MKGILFTEPMFHKVASGEKTQTRRIIKPQPDFISENFHLAKRNSGEVILPRYGVGEKIYLKEPYRVTSDFGDILMDIKLLGRPVPSVEYKYDNSHPESDWKNKLFMPATLARYFIEITSVRCERLQSISDEDCLKEGIYEDYIERDFFHYYDPENRYYCGDCEEVGRERLVKEALEDRESFGLDGLDDDTIREELDGYSCDDCDDSRAKTCDICGKDLSVFRNGLGEKFYSPLDAYAALIDNINGQGTWDSNPFVWVYDFRLTTHY
jgi:hypothetical protein